LERIADTHRALVIDFSAVPFVDATAAHTIEDLARQAARRGVKLVLSGASPVVRRDLHTHGITAPMVAYAATVDEALASLRG
jgi:SulP family sulfate permease